jgi:hypothetical protein
MSHKLASIAPSTLLRLSVGRMTSKRPGQREFAQFVANHVLVDQHGYMLPTVVHGNREPDHLGQYHRPPRPSLDGPLAVLSNRIFDLLRQVMIYEWAFPN